MSLPIELAENGTVTGLSDVACVAALLSSLRKKALDPPHKFRRRCVERRSEFKNCGERRAVLAAFEKAYVLRVVSTLETK